MHEFPLVEVAGTPREMGYQHGAQVAPLIQQYLGWIEKTTGRDRDELGRRAMAFLPHIENLSPQFVEEVRGLASGAGLSFEHALLCQVRSEASRADPDACTAFALTREATRTGAPLAGQNQDLPPEYGDLGIVLHLTPDDGRPPAITFTFAGQLGYMGMNRLGVAHFANAVGDFQWRMGLPHYPLKRRLLELRTVDECLQLLSRHRMCSAANMVVCDGDGAIADVEIRPEAIAVYEGEIEACRLHTNHYVTPEFSPFETFGSPGAPARLERLQDLVREAWGDITVEAMKGVLADHEGDPGGICRHGTGGSHSVAGYIAEPAAQVFHVRRGHGCTGSWRAYQV